MFQIKNTNTGTKEKLVKISNVLVLLQLGLNKFHQQFFLSLLLLWIMLVYVL